MIHRCLAALIVVFWLVMTAMLIDLELKPGRSQILAVPVSYVANLMFVQGLQSDLTVFEDSARIGRVTLRPKFEPVDQVRSLDFSGSLILKRPATLRLTFDGHAEFDRAIALQALRLDITVREPALRIGITADRDGRIRYELTQNGEMTKGKFDRGTAAMLAAGAGVGDNAIRNLGTSVESVSVTAKQGAIKIRDEKINAYVLTARFGDSDLGEVYITELGQVLMVRTPYGYTLSAEDSLLR
jgi:hypothetical protein